MFNLEKYYPLCYNVPYDGEDYGYGISSNSTIVRKTVNNYIATDGKYVYIVEKKGFSSDFAALHLKEPQIKISRFEGCSHYYGVMFMPNGDTYELKCKITKQYLSDAHEIRGDWQGYREGDTTSRFLSKANLMSAFSLFKEIIS